MTNKDRKHRAVPDRHKAFDGHIVGSVFFIAIFLFYWISLNPFVDLTAPSTLGPSAGKLNRLNQLVSVCLFLGLLIYGLRHPMRSAILQPRPLIAVIFVWLLLTSALSPLPILGIKGTVLALMVTVMAHVFLLLPVNERRFAMLLGLCTLIMLAVAYFGILFLPTLSIHQAAEVREPMNAGYWRGHFPHKNSAAAAMVLSTFFGLYLMRTWSRVLGLAVVCLSVVFLVHTGGKTSTAMLPGVLVLAYLFEKAKGLRAVISIFGIASFNILTVGTAVITPLREAVTALGIDATFTNRTDIWRFAFSAIADHPFTGYGLRAFWQTEALVYSGGSIETWAVEAANGHNSYLDIALTTGIPGLVLTILWLLVWPLWNYSRLSSEKQRTPMTRLFVRMWLYMVFYACLESLFYEGGNFAWFAILFAFQGLYLQNQAVLARTTPVVMRREAYA